VKHLCIILAIGTSLSGCGNSVEHWECPDSPNPRFNGNLTIDLENQTIGIGENYVTTIEENGKKVFWRMPGDYGGLAIFDRDTGRYILQNRLAKVCLKS
jgi:uncharacterized protein YceK